MTVKTTGGTLIINNSEKFSNDIWQTDDDFTEKEWKEAINSFVDNLQDIYNWLCDNDDCGFDMIDKLYILGDVINMLNSIEVKKQ